MCRAALCLVPKALNRRDCFVGSVEPQSFYPPILDEETCAFGESGVECSGETLVPVAGICC